MRFMTFVACLAVALGLGPSPSGLVHASDGHTLFMQSAVENANGTVTLPLHRGTSRGQIVYYVMTDSSDGSFAQHLSYFERSTGDGPLSGQRRMCAFDQDHTPGIDDDCADTNKRSFGIFAFHDLLRQGAASHSDLGFSDLGKQCQRRQIDNLPLPVIPG